MILKCCIIAVWLVFVVDSLGAPPQHPQPHQVKSEESLRGALNALTRKQRSLNGQSYYPDLATVKFRTERELRQGPQQVAPNPMDVNGGADDNDPTSLDFVPSDVGVGQLETIGDGYQNLQNNKQFGKALMYYLQAVGDQDQPVQSVFRERTNSKKRAGGTTRNALLSPRELVRILQDELYSSSNDDQPSLQDDDYRRTLDILYDKLGKQDENNFDGYGNRQLLDLNEILQDENEDGEADPRLTRVYPVARRNVNARYPLFENFGYRDISKRFPVSKRSADSNNKHQTTDPKVAKDLGPLFGSPVSNAVNFTHVSDHNSHNYDEHHHKINNTNTHVPDHNSHEHDEHYYILNNTDERPIQVQKKDVDWSQYFGLDKRKKKAVYMARPDSQDQDEQYLLQKYYELMAENLKPENGGGKSSGEKREKHQQIDSKLRNMKQMMIEEAAEIGSSSGDMDEQARKDEIMERMAAAYSLEKLRRALDELSASAAAQRQQQQHESKSHPPRQMDERKRNHNDLDFLNNGPEADECPQIGIVERRCKATEALIGDFRQVLHVPCVMYHICDACEHDECLEKFAMQAAKICKKEDLVETPWSKKHCLDAALQLTRYPPVIDSQSLCHSPDNESCLSQYHKRIRTLEHLANEKNVIYDYLNNHR